MSAARNDERALLLCTNAEKLRAKDTIEVVNFFFLFFFFSRKKSLHKETTRLCISAPPQIPSQPGRFFFFMFYRWFNRSLRRIFQNLTEKKQKERKKETKTPKISSTKIYISLYCGNNCWKYTLGKCKIANEKLIEGQAVIAAKLSDLTIFQRRSSMGTKYFISRIPFRTVNGFQFRVVEKSFCQSRRSSVMSPIMQQWSCRR